MRIQATALTCQRAYRSEPAPLLLLPRALDHPDMADAQVRRGFPWSTPAVNPRPLPAVPRHLQPSLRVMEAEVQAAPPTVVPVVIMPVSCRPRPERRCGWCPGTVLDVFGGERRRLFMLLLIAAAAVVPVAAAAATVANGHSSAARTSSGRISARALAVVDRRMFAIDPSVPSMSQTQRSSI